MPVVLIMSVTASCLGVYLDVVSVVVCSCLFDRFLTSAQETQNDYPGTIYQALSDTKMDKTLFPQARKLIVPNYYINGKVEGWAKFRSGTEDQVECLAGLGKDL